MQPTQSYDSRTIWFHWLTVLLIAGQWIGAHLIDEFPRGPLRIDAQSAHILFGVALGFLVLARIGWRLTRGRRMPDADRGVWNLLAKLVHWGLYLLILTVVGLGLGMLSQRSVSFFNLFMLPAMADGSREALRALHGNHELLANAILIVAAGHAAAALFHHYVRHDGVLARMVPRLSRP